MGHAMAIYDDHLRAIAELIELLNAWDKKHPEILIDEPIKIRHAAADVGEEYGELRDEIGGAWSFQPKVFEDKA